MRLLVAGLLLAGAAAGEEWTCARGDLQNTGVTRNRGPLTKPDVVWKREEEAAIGTGAALWGGMLVYGVGESVMACRRQSSGLDVWNGKVKQQVLAWPSVVEGFAYFGSPDRVHYVLRMTNGEEISDSEAEDAILASPAVTETHYINGCDDGLLYVMSSEKAQVLWRAKTGPVRHAPAVWKSTAYVVNQEGTLFALDLKRKKELWKYEAGARPLAAPMFSKGTVFLVLPGEVRSVDAKKGADGQRHEAKGISSAPALDATHLYYGTDGGEIVVLDWKADKERKRLKVADTAVTAPLILARKILYGAAGATLFAADPKGKVLWTYAGEGDFGPPMVADRAVYVARDNVFYCLR